MPWIHTSFSFFIVLGFSLGLQAEPGDAEMLSPKASRLAQIQFSAPYEVTLVFTRDKKASKSFDKDGYQRDVYNFQHSTRTLQLPQKKTFDYTPGHEWQDRSPGQFISQPEVVIPGGKMAAEDFPALQNMVLTWDRLPPEPPSSPDGLVQLPESFIHITGIDEIPSGLRYIGREVETSPGRTSLQWIPNSLEQGYRVLSTLLLPDMAEKITVALTANEKEIQDSIPGTHVEIESQVDMGAFFSSFPMNCSTNGDQMRCNFKSQVRGESTLVDLLILDRL